MCASYHETQDYANKKFLTARVRHVKFACMGDAMNEFLSKFLDMFSGMMAVFTIIAAVVYGGHLILVFGGGVPLAIYLTVTISVVASLIFAAVS